MHLPLPVRDRRAALVNVARETNAVLPGILHHLPHLNATRSEKLTFAQLPALDPDRCPAFTLPSNSAACGTPVKVINEDTLDAAIMMADCLTVPQVMQVAAGTMPAAAPQPNQRVVALNLASDKNPGGGWLSGASAQEEAICYRSSLAMSLPKSYYPWTPTEAVYTPDVVVIRSSMGSGHALLTARTPPAQLLVVSVISVAAIRRPETCQPSAARRRAPRRDTAVFKRPADRDLTKQNMRAVLRLAARERHERLVLGAMGCGAFKNPPRDVASCWAEVLSEDEFSGGWWREIWFAVFDRRNEGNFEIFDHVLGGKVFGEKAKV
ncbi:hypothetical protein F5Y18DRAFT_419834 [Xylariaceae sp. FL1019]|nr:hypothetical protein F5Y18DRAFT_419834 [Xylariaceae sp. FL1019]